MDETTMTIPQPLVINGKVSTYPSKDAVVADLALRLYANSNFDINNNKSLEQIAKDSLTRAIKFVKVASDYGEKNYIKALIGEQ